MLFCFVGRFVSAQIISHSRHRVFWLLFGCKGKDRIRIKKKKENKEEEKKKRVDHYWSGRICGDLMRKKRRGREKRKEDETKKNRTEEIEYNNKKKIIFSLSLALFLGIFLLTKNFSKKATVFLGVSSRCRFLFIARGRKQNNSYCFFKYCC